jgi:pimeloyl-ACP methyl ester carboxylesterase
MHVVEAGSGEPVLLLHGFPQHWWEWRHVIPELAESYRVIAPDLRGAGLTEAPRGGFHRDQLVADLVALLDALELRTVRIVAHDWSALVAFHLALSRPARVHGLIAISVPPPFIRFDPGLFRVMWRLWFDVVLPVPLVGPWLLRRGWLTRFLLRSPTCGGARTLAPEDLEAFLVPLRDRAHARAGAALYRRFILPEGVRIMGAYRDQRLVTPTRVLLGAEDPIVRAAMIRGFEPHVEHLAVDEVQGAGHFVVDDRPDALVKAARELFG